VSLVTGRFVAIGDSFTEGVGDGNVLYPNGVRGWADRLARQLGRHDPTWEYANLAIRSKTLDEVVTEQLDTALSLEPTVLSFYAGGNDILAVRVDLDGLLARYEDALRRLTGSGAQVLVFTCFDPRTGALLDRLRRRIHAYNNGVRHLAACHGATLLDHAGWREYDNQRLWSPDRIHMSRPGHKRLAAHVCDRLGVPHTLKLRDLPEWEPRHWREVLVEEYAFVSGEVIPLVRRRLRGVRDGDSLTPRWPEPVRPADGLKRLARQRGSAALERATG
jgi:lysophospholipase L1-like esterase